MTWNVEFAPSAIRGLDRLPAKITAVIVEFATVTLPGNPQMMSNPLRGDLEGLFSAHRGDYRVLFALSDETGVVLIIRVAHRADVYR